MPGTRAISTTSRCELQSIFFFLQDKAPKEIHAILAETLDYFLPGRAQELAASLLNERLIVGDSLVSNKACKTIFNFTAPYGQPDQINLPY